MGETDYVERPLSICLVRSNHSGPPAAYALESNHTYHRDSSMNFANDPGFVLFFTS